MKRTLWAGAISLILAAPFCAGPTGALARAADATEAALRQEYDERYKKLRADVDDMLAAQATLQRRFNALAAELGNHREENARTASQAVRTEDLRRLSDKLRDLGEALREMEHKRENDKRLILDQLEKLAKAPPPEPPPRTEKPKEKEPEKEKDKEEATEKEPEAGAVPAVTGPQSGYEYTVKKDDTLGAIVAAYRKNGVNVTQDQVMQANPKLKPRALRIGQKIFIPDPNAK